jgi:hypothetical protein
MNISNFRDQVHLYTMGAPVPLIDRVIREAATRFADVGAYQRKLTAFDRPSNTLNVTLTAPTDTRIKKVEWLKYSGKRIEYTSEKVLDDRIYGWETAVSQTPIGWFKGPNNKIVVAGQTPVTESGVFTAQVWLTPTVAATTFEDDFANEFEQAIIDGAIYLLNDPRHSWALDATRQEYAPRYIEAMRFAKNAADNVTQHKRAAIRYGG